VPVVLGPFEPFGLMVVVTSEQFMPLGDRPAVMATDPDSQHNEGSKKSNGEFEVESQFYSLARISEYLAMERGS
jgi:hypothetical protein